MLISFITSITWKHRQSYVLTLIVNGTFRQRFCIDNLYGSQFKIVYFCGIKLTLLKPRVLLYYSEPGKLSLIKVPALFLNFFPLRMNGCITNETEQMK